MKAHPSHIFTTYYCISHIIISHEDDQVLLLGIYGNLQTDSFDPIDVEMDFSTFYNLLTEATEPEDTLEAITNALNKPEDNYTTLDLCESGGVDFNDYLFAFLRIYEEEHQEETHNAEPPSYFLTAFIPRNQFIPEFINRRIACSAGERTDNLQFQLALKYRFYLYFKTTWAEDEALSLSNLSDPLVFTLAQTQFEKCQHDSSG